MGTYYIVPLYSGWAIKVLPATSLIHSVTHRFIQHCMPKLCLTFTYIFTMDASRAREGSVSCPTEDINPSLEKLGINPPSFWLWRGLWTQLPTRLGHTCQIKTNLRLQWIFHSWRQGKGKPGLSLPKALDHGAKIWHQLYQSMDKTHLGSKNGDSQIQCKGEEDSLTESGLSPTTQHTQKSTDHQLSCSPCLKCEITPKSQCRLVSKDPLQVSDHWVNLNENCLIMTLHSHTLTIVVNNLLLKTEHLTSVQPSEKGQWLFRFYVLVNTMWAFSWFALYVAWCFCAFWACVHSL